jgi:hypothetical protein
MSRPDAPPALLHNAGWASGAAIAWRGLGRGPLRDEVERIEVARGRGAWLHLQLSIGRGDARYRRDWNTAAALLALLEPGHGLDERAAERRLAQAIDAHAARLDWPRCLLVGRDAFSRESKVTLDDAATAFVALSKSTGSLWLRDRAPRLAPLHAPKLVEPGSVPMRGVRWDALLWFPDGIPPSLLSTALAQLHARRARESASGPSRYSRP